MKNPVKKIDELRERGYEVHVSHRRPVNSSVLGMRTREELKKLRLELPGDPGEELCFLPTGGRTDVSIAAPNGNEGVNAAAVCCDTDNFDRKRGLQIAAGRAVKMLTREDLYA